MSDIAVEEFLEHFGTKGMKWGSRKNNSTTTDGQEKKIVNKENVKKAAVAASVGYAGYKAEKGILKLTGHNKVTVALPTWGYADKNNVWTYGGFSRIRQVRVRDLPKITENPFSIG